MSGTADPIFPVLSKAEGYTTPSAGLSLRDYLAAACATGLLASPGTIKWDQHALARSAYAHADAMLA